MNKVEGVIPSEIFSRGSFMTWLSDIDSEKKCERNKFENPSKIEQN